jgi:GDP-4-dehydro-6-deoxy-D-mannose reductase
MKVLVTGATGFVGRHLIACCVERGATVAGVGRGPAADVELPEGLDSYLGADLTVPAAAREAVAAARPDLVFHLAAEASVARSWSDPAGTVKENVAMTLGVLDAVRREAPGARVLVTGSGEEYGEPESLPVVEDHPLRPQNPYAVSKVCAGLTAALFRDHGLPVVTTRAFNHTGPGQPDRYVVSSFARQIAAAEVRADGGGETELVTGDLDVRRDFTDVRDVVRAYWLAAEGAEPGVYNVCSGRSLLVSDILAALARETDLDVRQRTDPALLREHDVKEIQGSHERLTAATGWRPGIPLEKTLRDTLDWWRERVRAEVTS